MIIWTAVVFVRELKHNVVGSIDLEIVHYLNRIVVNDDLLVATLIDLLAVFKTHSETNVVQQRSTVEPFVDLVLVA